MQRVEEEAEVLFGIFLESTLYRRQLHDRRSAQLTLIESNRLFSFIASYTFSGMNASFLGSRSLE